MSTKQTEFQHISDLHSTSSTARVTKLSLSRSMSIGQQVVQSAGEYCNSTSIHGLAYLKSSPTFIEKLLWALIIIACLLLATLLIIAHFQDADENPIMTNIQTISVQDIPFPAVTINSGPSPKDTWRYASKILNWLKFDSYFNGKLVESNELTNKVTNILDQIIEQLTDSFQSPVSLIKRIEAQIPTFYEPFGKLYANYPEKDIDKAFKSVFKELLLHYNSTSEKAVLELFQAAIMPLYQKYPLNDYHSNASESSIQKAKKMATLAIYIITNRGDILGFGDFLSYFNETITFDSNLTTLLNTILQDQLSLGITWPSKERKISVRDLFAVLQTSTIFIDQRVSDCKIWFENCLKLTAVPDEWKHCCELFTLDLKNILTTMRESIQPAIPISEEYFLSEGENIIGRSQYENILTHPELKEQLITTLNSY